MSVAGVVLFTFGNSTSGVTLPTAYLPDRLHPFSQIIAGRLERALRTEDLTLAQHNALQQALWTPGVSAAKPWNRPSWRG
ncbi:hypothetical protein [Streptomyces sp. NPDC050704]|uniref:hypothetical protein n=1 Tax=Streptomyces sp. NPDC050704 TaxID=3157219 RepID=UPI003437B088